MTHMRSTISGARVGAAPSAAAPPPVQPATLRLANAAVALPSPNGGRQGRGNVAESPPPSRWPRRLPRRHLARGACRLLARSPLQPPRRSTLPPLAPAPLPGSTRHWRRRPFRSCANLRGHQDHRRRRVAVAARRCVVPPPPPTPRNHRAFLPPPTRRQWRSRGRRLPHRRRPLSPPPPCALAAVAATRVGSSRRRRSARHRRDMPPPPPTPRIPPACPPRQASLLRKGADAIPLLAAASACRLTAAGRGPRRRFAATRHRRTAAARRRPPPPSRRQALAPFTAPAGRPSRRATSAPCRRHLHRPANASLPQLLSRRRPPTRPPLFCGGGGRRRVRGLGLDPQRTPPPPPRLPPPPSFPARSRLLRSHVQRHHNCHRAGRDQSWGQRAGCGGGCSAPAARGALRGIGRGGWVLSRHPTCSRGIDGERGHRQPTVFLVTHGYTSRTMRTWLVTNENRLKTPRRRAETPNLGRQGRSRLSSPSRADSDLAWVHHGRGPSWIREIASLQWWTNLGIGRVSFILVVLAVGHAMPTE